MSRTVRALRLVAATTALQSAGVTAVAVAVHGLLGGARDLGNASSAPGDPARVGVALETVAWAGLALCALWFTAAVLACARDLARHPARPAPVAARDCLRPAFVRSLLVVLVGGCLATPSPTPVAEVVPGPGWDVLDGLPLPGLPTGRAPRAHPRVLVHPGDCLWSITESLVGTRSTAADIARAWPRLHRANRDVVGPDPDVLRPGTRLRVPADLTADLTTAPSAPAGAAR